MFVGLCTWPQKPASSVGRGHFSAYREASSASVIPNLRVYSRPTIQKLVTETHSEPPKLKVGVPGKSDIPESQENSPTPTVGLDMESRRFTFHHIKPQGFRSSPIDPHREVVWSRRHGKFLRFPIPDATDLLPI